MDNLTTWAFPRAENAGIVTRITEVAQIRTKITPNAIGL